VILAQYGRQEIPDVNQANIPIHGVLALRYESTKGMMRRFPNLGGNTKTDLDHDSKTNTVSARE
jgi:hypothetical protein